MAEIERKNKLLEDSQAANKVMSDKYARECQDKARLQNQHNILLDTRYIVDRKTVEVTKVERLTDIEMQLFRGIQEINKEKGRREYKPEPEQPVADGNVPATTPEQGEDLQTGVCMDDSLRTLNEEHSEDFSFQSSTPKIAKMTYKEQQEDFNIPLPGTEVQVTVLEAEELSESAKQGILNSGSVQMQANGPATAGASQPEEAKTGGKQEERQE